MFDGSKSSTFKDIGGSFAQPIISVSGGSYFGGAAIDTAALSDGLNVDNFTFGLVKQVAGLDFVYNKVSGTLGMGYTSPLSGGKSFLSMLPLNELSYSIYLKGKDQRSYLHFPGMDLDNHEVVRTHKIIDKTWINLNLTHVG